MKWLRLYYIFIVCVFMNDSLVESKDWCSWLRVTWLQPAGHVVDGRRTHFTTTQCHVTWRHVIVCVCVVCVRNEALEIIQVTECRRVIGTLLYFVCSKTFTMETWCAHARKYAQTNKRTLTPAHTHTCTHTRVHTRTHAHTQTHNTLSLSLDHHRYPSPLPSIPSLHSLVQRIHYKLASLTSKTISLSQIINFLHSPSPYHKYGVP